MDSIVLKIGNSLVTGWLSVETHLSIEDLSGAFKLITTDRSGATDITPGASCTLIINGNVVINGYIDKVAPTYDHQKHEIDIQGRDKTGDLIDCSIINPPFQYKGLTIDQIIKRIAAPFGIGVTKNVDTGAPIPTFNIDQGAKAFEVIYKLCQMRQCLAISDNKGNIIITRAGASGNGTPLIEGKNILRGNGDYDVSKRYSIYVVKGQKQGNDSSSSQSIAENKTVVTDDFIKRYRPLMIVSSGQADANDTAQRARWEATTRKGQSRRLIITVAGWQQQDGGLWALNTIINVNAPMLFCKDNLLLSEVKFIMNGDEGQISELTLVSPEAYQFLTKNKLSKKGNKGSSNSTSTTTSNALFDN